MGKIAFLLTGQGAQYPGMGQDLYNTSPAAKAVFDMGEELCPGIISICFESDKETLSQTKNTQPALFLCDLACARAAAEAGICADAVAGFSLGEIAALAFSGVLSDSDAFRLVCLRAERMSASAEKIPGGMCAVMKLSPDKVEELCSSFEGVFPVNYNCPGQIAVAGVANEIDLFMASVKESGGRAVKLAVSGAFHTPFMSDATKALHEFMTGLDISSPRIPLYSNLTGEVYPSDRDDIIETVAKQASNSVRFETILRNMNHAGIDTFVEAGAGKTLTGFVTRTVEGARTYVIGDSVGLTNSANEICNK